MRLLVCLEDHKNFSDALCSMAKSLYTDFSYCYAVRSRMNNIRILCSDFYQVIWIQQAMGENG